MSYKKPILSEIYTEVYFSNNSLQQKDFFTIIPLLKEHGLADVEIGQVNNIIMNTSSPMTQELQHLSIPRIKCWNTNKTSLVQLSPDLLIINNVEQYIGWTKYKDFLMKIYSIINTTLNSPKMASISLVTIDKFEVSTDSYVLDKYLNCNGDIIPKWYKGSKEAIDLILGHYFLNADDKNRQVRVVVRPQVKKVSVEFQSTFHNKIDDNDSNIDKVLEQLHDESNKSFELIITDTTRQEIMGGMK